MTHSSLCAAEKATRPKRQGFGRKTALIGNDKIEIIHIAEKIGTYETSCLPYEDCCTVFTPRHPCTRPKLEHVERAEGALDIDALVDAAVAGTEMIQL